MNTLFSSLSLVEISVELMFRLYFRKAMAPARGGMKLKTLQRAFLNDANLEGKFLKGAVILTIVHLSEVRTLYSAELDSELERQVR